MNAKYFVSLQRFLRRVGEQTQKKEAPTTCVSASRSL